MEGSSVTTSSSQQWLTKTSANNSKRSDACPFCGKTLYKKRALQHHIMIHTGERPHQCSLCHKTFIQKGTLHRHWQVHTGERKYACGYCYRRFFQSHDVKRHVRLHTGEKPFRCPICEERFRLKCSLTNHLKAYHPECQKNFGSRKDLNKHRHRRARSPNWKPDLPGHDGTSGRQELQSSARSRGKPRERGDTVAVTEKILHLPEQRLRCPKCEKTFGQKHHLIVHMTSHKERKLICCYCPRRFPSKANLMHHINEVHTKQEADPLQCSHCEIKVSRKCKLAVHEQNCSAEKQLLRCPKCMKTFKRRNGLTVHLKFHNEEDQAFDYYPRSFPTDADLTQYLGVHAGKFPFYCVQCGLGFQNEAALTQHLDQPCDN